ncbi:radical SAM protein [Pyrococcus sp. ST04]|uniref:radical SAM protein n=1 Tax=Pyrococcus sp. ST04 TaxID=1183377 RepID=UPI00026059DB|nr:radical SAM protein [Pyrococcus sp. ST04]AFK21900.1 putative biotin synthase [Pyrococcus sp. ST04]
MVEMIRVSYGTAIAMGLIKARLLARPTTAYLMLYHQGKCMNDCKFCPQARSSKAGSEKLSRVTWPEFPIERVRVYFPNGNFRRVCLQTIDYQGMIDDTLEILGMLADFNVPISVSITPVPRDVLEEFKELGVDYIGVGLDVASERIYKEIKISRHSWAEMWRFFHNVVKVFGRGRAVVHLIVGLGETDKELLETIHKVYEEGGLVSLFAFTPIKGTALENLAPPPIERYRKIQAAHYLIKTGVAGLEDFEFDENGNLIRLPKVDIPAIAFVTQGCPWCNRPYYNERPGKEPYNFPDVELVDVEKIKRELI